MTEWEQVVDAWQLETWEAYRDVIRLGRKTRLPEKQRAVLWSIFERVRARSQKPEYGNVFRLVQPIGVQVHRKANTHLSIILSWTNHRILALPNCDFLLPLGPGNQIACFLPVTLVKGFFSSLFHGKHSVSIFEGAPDTLRINYRTSHQIRMQADRLLGPELSDVDGNTEDRRGTISVFNGPKPTIMVFDTQEDEIASVSQWISDRIDEGFDAP